MSSTDERYTPGQVLDPMVRVFGPLALDPCAPAHNPTGARNFYTKERNGLVQNWAAGARGGWAFVNPPFSELITWVALVIFWARRGVEIVLLTPQDSTPLWHDALDESAALACPLKRRVRYVYPEGAAQPKGCAMFATTLWYLGSRQSLFVAAMHGHGHLYQPGRFRRHELRPTSALMVGAALKTTASPASVPDENEGTEP